MARVYRVYEEKYKNHIIRAKVVEPDEMGFGKAVFEAVKNERVVKEENRISNLRRWIRNRGSSNG